ncbi:hypothetical protein QYE76_049315 [Lolium multiflorum]|uniref:Transposase (putative) gypsy type domain-containing protein n=1 Tax=Lolium multiflorum TaxID=4521 RepID=A0AAD8SMV5_LOLMU|nr:hypothetical protein QYE76_049315 [Lolium multiflorum]
MTPNSILHLSIFITMCEAFLGIDPHWGLWRKIFYVKRHNADFATVDDVADFADQFTFLESENVQLRKTIKTSADRVLEANMLTAEAQNENILLKNELKKLKKKMKDEQEARREASILVDEKKVLFESPS